MLSLLDLFDSSDVLGPFMLNEFLDLLDDLRLNNKLSVLF